MSTTSDHLQLNRGTAEPDRRAGPGRAAFVIASVVFIATRFWRLDAFDFWADEITTLQAVRGDWHALWAFMRMDVVHPPLFYLLLKVWIGVGADSSLWARFFPCLTAIATIAPFYLLGRELNLRLGETGVALALAAVNGYLIHYAQELRMYSLLLLLTVCSLWRFARFFNAASGTTLAALMLVNLLLVYTHYFGWLVVGVEFIVLMFHGNRRLYWFCLGMAAVVVCFSPWIYIVSQAAGQKGGLSLILEWIQQPRPLDLIWLFVILNGPLPSNWPGSLSLIGLLLFGYPVALWMRSILSRGQHDERAAFWWLLLLCSVPVAVVWGVSQILSYPVWHPRYLIIIAVPYFILVSVSLSRVQPSWLRLTTTLLALTWATLSGYNELRNTDRVAWHSLMRHMIHAEATSDPSVTVYTIGSHGIDSYLNAVQGNRFTIMRLRDRHLAWGERFWVSFRSAGDRYRFAFFDAARLEQQRLRELKEQFTAAGYTVGEGFLAGSPGYRHYLFPVWR